MIRFFYTFSPFRTSGYHNFLVSVVMKSGLKSKACSLVFSSYSIIRQTRKLSLGLCLSFLTTAVGNLIPVVQTRKTIKAGVIQNIPCSISDEKALSKAIGWLVSSARLRTEKSFSVCLANEIMDAYDKKGKAFSKKQDLYKLVQNNRSLLSVRRNNTPRLIRRIK